MSTRPVAIVVGKLMPADHNFPGLLATELGACGWQVVELPFRAVKQMLTRAVNVSRRRCDPVVVFSVNCWSDLAWASVELGFRYISLGEIVPMDPPKLNPLPAGARVRTFEAAGEVATWFGSQGIESSFHPMGFDPRVFNVDRTPRDLDVSFVGNGLSYGTLVVDKFAQKIRLEAAKGPKDGVKRRANEVVLEILAELRPLPWVELERCKGRHEQRADAALASRNLPVEVDAVARLVMAELAGPLRGHFARIQRIETVAEVARRSGVVIFGRDWEHTPLASNARGSISYQRTASVFRRSRIVLHVHRFYMEGINDRMLNVPACGALLVTRKTDELERILEPGREVVTYETAEEAADKVEFYLRNERARRAIADAGCRRVHAEHSFGRRLKTVLDMCKLPHSGTVAA